MSREANDYCRVWRTHDPLGNAHELERTGPHSGEAQRAAVMRIRLYREAHRGSARSAIEGHTVLEKRAKHQGRLARSQPCHHK